MIVLTTQDLTAHISPLGAKLSGLWHKSQTNNLIISALPSETAEVDPFYCGALVGPVANRVENGQVMIDGTPWQMDQNEQETCLHSGRDGLHSQLWEIVRQTVDQVELSTQLEHGTCGLPGNRTITAKYTLSAGDLLQLDIVAESDRETVMNIAHHPYWNLSASETVADHLLEVAAETFLPTNAQSLPTGEICDIADTVYDFRVARPVPIDTSLDANLCLAPSQRQKPELAARLTGPNGLELEISTTEPGLQVYNGSGMQDVGLALENGQTFRPFAGIALEPQGWPNAPNTVGFPSISLAPGQVYQQQTVYRISQ